MKNVTLETYTTDADYPKIVKAVESALRSKNFVTPSEVFISMGVLAGPEVKNWGEGRLPYLEQASKCHLAKASRILHILRFHAHDLPLKPSVTVYQRQRKVKGRQIPLQFSQSGDGHLEEAYARHFVKLSQASAGKALTTAPAAAARPRAG